MTTETATGGDDSHRSRSNSTTVGALAFRDIVFPDLNAWRYQMVVTLDVVRR